MRSVLISRTKAWTALFTFVTLYAGTSLAADDATLLKDLTAVIALLGLPCGQVVSATRQADNDHIATCNNGNRYRVFVNPQGRVVAQKR